MLLSFINDLYYKILIRYIINIVKLKNIIIEIIKNIKLIYIKNPYLFF